MQFHAKHALVALALAGTTLFVVQSLHAQQATEKPAQSAAGGMDPAVMAKMMQLAQPGKPHEELVKRVGKWDTKYKMRMSPDAPWMEFSGTMEVKPLLGGRYVMEESSFDMMGMPMEGRQQLGYDTNKKKYVSTWIDNFGSYMTTMEGDWDEKTKTLTLHSDMFDPMSGSTVKTKMTTDHVSKDHMIFRMTFPSPDGKDFVGMEVDSKRRK